MSDSRPPLTLEEHAAISAELVEGVPLVDVLRSHELSDEDWNRETLRVTGALAADVRAHGVRAELPLLYASAFSDAQDRLRRIPDLTVEQWASLEHRLETEDAARVLAEHGLRFADRLRLSRHWSQRLSKEVEVARRYREIVDTLRSA